MTKYNTKYKFETDNEGNFINPNTNQKFKHGDIYNDMCYNCKRNNRPEFLSKPNFLKREEIKKQRFGGKTRTAGGLASNLVNGAKKRCRLRGGSVTISQKRVRQVILENKCQITGLPFQLFGKDQVKNPFSPSLDRKNNKDRNYSNENTQVILNAINLAKNEWEEEDLKIIVPAYARALTEKREKGTQTD